MHLYDHSRHRRDHLLATNAHLFASHAQWQAGEPSNEPTVSCWLDEAASEEASKDVWVCVHTHPCLDYEDDDKVPHAEDSW